MQQGGQPQQSTGFMLLQKHGAGPCRCSQEQFKPFVDGVEAVLQQWTALLLVNNHRDSEALTIIRDEVLKWFWEDGEVYSDELETYFEDFFESVRYVMVEDGSCKEVSDVLHDMYVGCARDDLRLVEHYQRTLPVYRNANPVQNSVFGGMWAMDADGQQVNVQGCAPGDAEDDDEDDDEPVGDAPTNGPVAEDEEQITQPPARTQPNRNQKQKNPFKKGNDGWCTVERRR